MSKSSAELLCSNRAADNHGSLCLTIFASMPYFIGAEHVAYSEREDTKVPYERDHSELERGQVLKSSILKEIQGLSTFSMLQVPANGTDSLGPTY
jgi:hypothetical protein